jgi:hypothetical protein
MLLMGPLLRSVGSGGGALRLETLHAMFVDVR